MTCCSSLKTLRIPTQAMRPCAVLNVLGEWLSLAGFQVTIIGRIWVTAEITLDPAYLADITPG